MQCPVCSKRARTYGGRCYGTIRLRYRKCTECGHKFKTFEEIDTGPKVRSYERWPEFDAPVSGISNCPQCSGETKAIGKSVNDKIVRRQHVCQSCGLGVCFTSCESDPIGAVLAQNAADKRVHCPKCNAVATVKSTIPAKAHVSRRYVCNGCENRFTIKTPHSVEAHTDQTLSREIAEHEIAHRVLP